MTTTRKPDTTDKADEKGTPETEGDDTPKVDLVWQAVYELATYGRLGPETTEAMTEALALPNYGGDGAKSSGPSDQDGPKDARS
jgi:hypothetical protein